MPVNSAEARLAVAAITNFEKRTVDAQSDPFKEVKYWRKEGMFVTKSHGIALQWQAVLARQSTTGFNRETRTNFVPTNRLAACTLSNCGYSAAGQIHQTDLWEAMGDQQLVDLMKHEIEWTPEAMWRSITQDWYRAGTTNTNSGNPIIGLNGAIINTGTYANVTYASDTATFFGSGNNVLSGGIHTAFSTDPIPSLTASILAGEQGTDAGESVMFPNAAWFSYTDWAYVHNALQAQLRGEMAQSKYETGAKDLTYMGVPLFRTRFLSSGTYWVTNSNFMDFRTPAPKILNPFQREEPSPWSIIFLMVFYGLFRVILPRAFVKVTVS